MKHLLLTTIAAVVLVGCGPSKQSPPPAEAKPEPPTAKAPAISIWDAARTGNIEAVKQHLASGMDVNENYGNGETPLFTAAAWGHKEIVELLIAAGADVNAKNHRGVTPLHMASDHKEIAALLIAEGADVNAKNDGGWTPLDYADDKETANLLRKHGGKRGEEVKPVEPIAEAAKPKPPTAETPRISIHDAARQGKIEAVKQHLAAGTDVNAKHDEFGTTPLHNAALYDHKEIAELLIAKGADLNAKNMFGETPLDSAIRLDQTETADLLRKHGGKTGKELIAEGK